MGRKSKMEQNTKDIKEIFDKINEKEKLNEYIEQNLSGYLTNAIRLALYYGNLRIRYVGFNFTLIAFFVSILAFYMPLIVSFNTSLGNTGLPLIIGFFVYLGLFMYFYLEGIRPLHSVIRTWGIIIFS